MSYRKKIFVTAGGVGIFLVVIICILLLIRYPVINNEEVKSKQVVSEFIMQVFEEPKEAQSKALGVVKFNLANTKQTGTYEIIDIGVEHIHVSTNLLKVFTKVEFQNNKTDHDVVFYIIDLINEEGNWKVISLEETSPQLSDKGIIDMADSDKKDIKRLFKSFAEDMKTDYRLSEKYLISKAKRSHKSSYSFLESRAIKTNIKNVSLDKVMYFSNNIAITKISYDNNSKYMNVLLSLFRTSKGWKIYDIKQI
ncbi:MAG: hypothetical protein MJA82_03555 [Clostridia bacterium]|nr:hypothetical protein [Clostridia bacterium]